MNLKKCQACGTYTLGDSCTRCQGKTKTAEPPKYSPQNKYAKYRRMMKEEMKRG